MSHTAGTAKDQRELSDKEWAEKHGIVCHAPDGADRCEGCSHYYGRADVCIFARASKSGSAV